mgnify:CR=1 FL=1
MSDAETVDTEPARWLQKLRVLLLAARPAQIALILLVYLMGVGVSVGRSPSSMAPTSQTDPATVLTPVLGRQIVLGGLVLVPLAATVHYANEYVDVETDAITDRTPFSGGSGALERTGLPRSVLATATTAAALVTVAAVAAVRVTVGLSGGAVALLLVMLVLGLVYSLPPLALVRRGVGELVNATLGGLVLPVYGVAVVGTPDLLAVVVVLPFALLVWCNLFATHWPDRHADAAVGKRTLAVRWSAQGVRRGYTVLAVVAGVGTTVLWLRGVLPDAVAAAHLVPVPFLVWGWRDLTRRRSPLPAVLAMVSLAVSATASWWWLGLS